MQEKRLQNKNHFTLAQRLVTTLSRRSILIDFFRNRIFFHVFLLLDGILAILLNKFMRCKRHHDRRLKNDIIPYPHFSLKAPKKHLLKTWFI